MLQEEKWCSKKLHYRSNGSGLNRQQFPKNENSLSEEQKLEIDKFLNSYREGAGITSQSLFEYLLGVSVDMAASDSYQGNAAAILPFAQAVTLIMNHAHAAEWFDGGEEWH